MANNEENFEEMYSSDQNNNLESDNKTSRQIKKEAKKGAAKFASKAAKGVSTMARRAVVAGLPWSAIILGLLLLIITLIGIIVFVFSGPDILRGQLVKMLDELFSSIGDALVTVAVGSDYAAVTEQNVLDVANYIQNMGYNLVGYGFVDDTELKMFEKDEKTGKIKKVSSSTISDYLAAENRTYMLSEVSLKSLFTGISEAVNGNEDASYSKGMLNVSKRIEDVTSIKIDGKEVPYYQLVDGENNGIGGTKPILGRDIKIDRAARKMTLTLTSYRMVNLQKKKTVTTCVYNLDGWVGKYGKPIEFLLALHLGTMAPKFAKAVATDPEFETKVNINLFKSVEVVKLKYRGLGMKELQDKLIERTNVWWDYYQQLNNNPNQKTHYTRQDAVNKAQSELGFSQKDLEDAKKYEKENLKEKYTPYIVNVENHWYKDLKFKDLEGEKKDDAYVKTLPSSKQSGKYKDKFEIWTYSSGEIYQVAEPKKSDVNKRLNQLFDDEKWLRVDGINAIPAIESDLLHEKKRKKIDPNGLDMQIVMTMLEKAEQKSDDAKYIVRDLKEFLETKGFKFKDSVILSPDGRVINNNTDGTNGEGPSGGSAGGSGSPSGTGSIRRLNNLLGGKQVVSVASGNDLIVKTNETQAGTTVKSIVGGKVEKVSENAVQINITSPSNLKGKTLIISGISMDSAIKAGDAINNNSPIAKTVQGTDIKIKMQDENKNSMSVKDNI